ncbi:MAG: hypothetical protein RL380_256, partial [Verrucomicrobiota bacterium]
APSSGNTYVVPDTKTIRSTQNTTNTQYFLGDSLTIQSGALWNMAHGAEPIALTVTNLFIEGGARLVNVQNPGSTRIAGDSLTVGGGVSNTTPVWMYTPNQSGCVIIVGHNITNAAGSTAGIELGRRPPLHTSSSDANSLYKFLGNNSGFVGGFRLHQDSKVTFVSQNSIGTGAILFTNFFPGVLKVPQFIFTNSLSFTNPVTVAADLAMTIQVTNAAVVSASGAWSYTNTLTIDGGGTFAVGTAGTLTASPTINLLNNSTFDVSAASGLTLGGASANLTLNAKGALKGNLTASTGGTIRPGGATVVGNLTVSNLTLTGGATQVVDFGATTNDVVFVTGNLSASGVTVIQVTTPPGNTTVGALYPIYKVTGTLGGSAANYTVDSSAVPQTFTVTNDTINKIVYLRLASSPAPKNLVWRGDVVAGTANAWAAGPLLNWLDGANPTNFAGGDNVTFTDASATNQPTLNVGVFVNAMTVNASSNYNFTGTGEIAGPAKLTKNGTGTLTLGTANSFSGGTSIENGLVNLNNSGALGSPAGATLVAVTNGASLDIVSNRLDSASKFVVVSGSGISSTRGALSGSVGQNAPANGTIFPPTGVRALRLAGNAVIGGNPSGGNGIWGIGLTTKGQDNADANNLLGILDGQGFSLTKIGSDFLILFATNASPVSQFTVAGGTVLFQGVNGTPALGTTCPIAISNNAAIDTWDHQHDGFGLTFANNFTIGAGGGQIKNSRSPVLFGRAPQDTYNGSITLNGGALTLVCSSSFGGLPNNLPTWGKLTVNGAISGTNDVACIGPVAQYTSANNIINFVGNNTYSGATLVSNYMTLQTTTANQSGGSYNIRDNCGLDVATGNGQLTLPMSTLTLGEFGGNLLSFARVASPIPATPLIYATNLVLNQAFGTVTVTPPTPSGLAVATYNLIKYNGAIGGSGYAFTLAPVPRGVSATLVNNPPTVDLNVTDVSGVVWTGAASSSWDTGGANLNWNFGGATAYADNDFVKFDDTATSFTVGISNTVTPAAIKVNSTGNYVFGGTSAIAGAANLVKQGSGSLTLSNAHSFTGGVTLDAGEIDLGNNSSLGSGTVNLNGGILASLGAQRTVANNFILGGNPQFGGQGQQLVVNGGVNLGGATRTFTLGNSLYLNGQIANGGIQLVRTGGFQILGLAGVNTFTGGILITTNCAVNLQNANGLGSAGTIEFLGASELWWANGVTTDLSSRLKVDDDSTATLKTGNNTVTFASSPAFGPLGNANLQKDESGTLVLNAAVTNNGTVTIVAGTLTLGASGSIPNAGRITVGSGATFNVAANGFVLGTGKTLANHASASTGNLVGNVTATNGIIRATYTNGTPSFSISSGALSLLSANTVFVVSNTGPALVAGSYKIVSAGAGGSVTGTTPTVTVTGGGLAAGTASLQITGGELYLVVSSSATPPTILPTYVDGSNQFVLRVATDLGFNYVLQSTTNLTIPINWTSLSTNAGTGGILTNAVPVNAVPPQRFYRYQVQ